MSSDNDNEGFQLQLQQSFDLVELANSKVPTLDINLNDGCQQNLGNSSAGLTPPISTYVQMKNCPTPSYINTSYSYEHKQRKQNKVNSQSSVMSKGSNLYQSPNNTRYQARGNVAWSSSEENYLHQQFTEQRYQLIYQKFKTDRSNYQYFRQYARNQYKTFDDHDDIQDDSDCCQFSDSSQEQYTTNIHGMTSQLNNIIKSQKIKQQDDAQSRNLLQSTNQRYSVQKHQNTQNFKQKQNQTQKQMKFIRKSTNIEHQNYKKTLNIKQDLQGNKKSIKSKNKRKQKGETKNKLDFDKIQKLITSGSNNQLKQLVFRSNFQSGNLEKVYIKKHKTKEKSVNKSHIQTKNIQKGKQQNKSQSCFNQYICKSKEENDQNLQRMQRTAAYHGSSFSTQNPQAHCHLHSNCQSHKAKSQHKQYYLVLSNDTNTIGFNQWFYFKVHNPNYDKEIKATFIIVNVSKKTIQNIAQAGVHYFSAYDYKFDKIGWTRTFDGICVNNKNNILKDQVNFYHTLQFQFKIRSRDIVYFALTTPYTYTKLSEFTKTHSQHFQILGTTFSGNPIHLYKIGSQAANKSILITARQHPSETSSSFVVEGVINRLSKPSLLTNLLKKRYQIYVLPMVNPDGVIHGNSRTNLLGFDVNRKWEILPNKRHSYEVFNIITGLLKKIPKVEYLIDLHGHSKKLNTFAYFSTKRTIATIISIQMAQKMPWFTISDCQMATAMPPLNTLRWYATSNLQVEKAITIQTSIHGWRDSNRVIQAFTPQALEQIGSNLIDIISRIQLQKKSNMNLTLKSYKNINFAQCHQSSDSDPEGDYLRQINQSKQQSNVNSTNNIQSSQKLQKNQSVSNKLRIKTCSTNFYKPTLNSTIRQRTRTEYSVQKVSLQIITPKNKNQIEKQKQKQKIGGIVDAKKLTRKKNVQTKFYRTKQKNVTSIKKIVSGYNDVVHSLNFSYQPRDTDKDRQKQKKIYKNKQLKDRISKNNSMEINKERNQPHRSENKNLTKVQQYKNKQQGKQTYNKPIDVQKQKQKQDYKLQQSDQSKQQKKQGQQKKYKQFKQDTFIQLSSINYNIVNYNNANIVNIHTNTTISSNNNTRSFNNTVIFAHPDLSTSSSNMNERKNMGPNTNIEIKTSTSSNMNTSIKSPVIATSFQKAGNNPRSTGSSINNHINPNFLNICINNINADIGPNPNPNVITNNNYGGSIPNVSGVGIATNPNLCTLNTIGRILKKKVRQFHSEKQQQIKQHQAKQQVRQKLKQSRESKQSKQTNKDLSINMPSFEKSSSSVFVMDSDYSEPAYRINKQKQTQMRRSGKKQRDGQRQRLISIKSKLQ